MCKRDTPDPLVRMFLDQYGLNLLAVPRHDADIGDLYVEDPAGVSTPGKAAHLLTPALVLPEIHRGEAMADIDAALSNRIASKAAFGLLDGFLTALGVGGVVNKLKASAEHARASVLRFRVTNATRDWIDPLALGARLVKSQLVKDHPFVAADNRYYLVTGVARTRSISVTAERNAKTGGSVDIGLAGVGELSAGVEIARSPTGEVTFTGPTPMAFGVQLHELAVDGRRGRLILKNTGAVAVKGKRPTEKPLVEPAFIGGPTADAFVAIR
jgi:hypothetical protein